MLVYWLRAIRLLSVLPLAYLYLYHHEEITNKNKIHTASLISIYVSLLLYLGILSMHNIICICVSLYIQAFSLSMIHMATSLPCSI